MEIKERTDRIRIHSDARLLYDELRDEQGKISENKPFEKLKDIFLFAAIIGYNNGKRKPLGDGKIETNMRMEVFSEDDREIMKALAIAATDNIEVLKKKSIDIISGNVLDVVEEYANGGIYELKRLIINQPGSNLTNLVNLVLQS